SYHDFIGFEVSRPVLEQAFRETYGLELKDVLVNEDKVLNSYRHDVSKPSPYERFLAFLYKLIPKFGPLKILQFRTPTPQTEQMFEASFNATLERYRERLTEV